MLDVGGDAWRLRIDAGGLSCARVVIRVSTDGGSVAIALIVGARRVAERFGDAGGVRDRGKNIITVEVATVNASLG